MFGTKKSNFFGRSTSRLGARSTSRLFSRSPSQSVSPSPSPSRFADRSPSQVSSASCKSKRQLSGGSVWSGTFGKVVTGLRCALRHRGVSSDRHVDEACAHWEPEEKSHQNDFERCLEEAMLSEALLTFQEECLSRMVSDPRYELLVQELDRFKGFLIGEILGAVHHIILQAKSVAHTWEGEADRLKVKTGTIEFVSCLPNESTVGNACSPNDAPNAGIRLGNHTSRELPCEAISCQLPAPSWHAEKPSTQWPSTSSSSLSRQHSKESQTSLIFVSQRQQTQVQDNLSCRQAELHVDEMENETSEYSDADSEACPGRILTSETLLTGSTRVQTDETLLENFNAIQRTEIQFFPSTGDHAFDAGEGENTVQRRIRQREACIGLQKWWRGLEFVRGKKASACAEDIKNKRSRKNRKLENSATPTSEVEGLTPKRISSNKSMKKRSANENQEALAHEDAMLQNLTRGRSSNTNPEAPSFTGDLGQSQEPPQPHLARTPSAKKRDSTEIGLSDYRRQLDQASKNVMIPKPRLNACGGATASPYALSSPR